MIPFSTFARWDPGHTPLGVNHQGDFVATTISFNLPPGEPLSTAVAAIDRTMAEIRMPGTIHGGFQGTARTFQQSLSDEPLLILAALAAVYIVLGILYESYAHPLTILSTLPSAGVGALLALMAFHIEFTVMSLIGVILLIGIVKKNAIMMVDFAIDATREGMSSREAIYHASLTENYCGTLDANDNPITDCVDPLAAKGTELPITPKIKGNLTARYNFDLWNQQAYVQAAAFTLPAIAP